MRQPLGTLEFKVFGLIAHAVREGLPCPTSRYLAAKCGGSAKTSGFFQVLAAKGWIVSERNGSCRRVGLLHPETGEVTGWTEWSKTGPKREQMTAHRRPLDAEAVRREHEQYWLARERERYGPIKLAKPLSEQAA